MYVQRNEARSSNHYCRRKTIIVTYISGFVALAIQHRKCMHLVTVNLWPVWFYNIVPHYLINVTIFGGGDTEHKMCFDFLYKFGMKRFPFSEELSGI